MKVLQRGASGACVFALCALAMWFAHITPHLVGALQKPISTKGRIGTVVANRVFSIRVDRVDVASGIVKRDVLAGDRRIPTPGIFVIVYLNAKSDTKPLRLGRVRLITHGGVAYDEAGRLDVITPESSYEPMLWRSAYHLFEIPKDRLAGARLSVGLSDLIDDLSAASEVDLGIGAREAARLLARPPSDYALKAS